MQLNDAIEVPFEAVPPAAPVAQAEKIIVMQLISPNSCVFVCLAAEGENDRFEIGVMKK